MSKIKYQANENVNLDSILDQLAKEYSNERI